MTARALIWYVNAVLCGMTALMTAYSGNAMCFAWVVAAGLEWRIANNLRHGKKGENDE